MAYSDGWDSVAGGGEEGVDTFLAVAVLLVECAESDVEAGVGVDADGDGTADALAAGALPLALGADSTVVVKVVVVVVVAGVSVMDGATLASEADVKVVGEGGELEAEVVPGLCMCMCSAGVSVPPPDGNSEAGHGELDGVCAVFPPPGDACDGMLTTQLQTVTAGSTCAARFRRTRR